MKKKDEYCYVTLIYLYNCCLRREYHNIFMFQKNVYHQLRTNERQKKYFIIFSSSVLVKFYRNNFNQYFHLTSFLLSLFLFLCKRVFTRQAAVCKYAGICYIKSSWKFVFIIKGKCVFFWKVSYKYRFIYMSTIILGAEKGC